MITTIHKISIHTRFVLILNFCGLCVFDFRLLVVLNSCTNVFVFGIILFTLKTCTIFANVIYKSMRMSESKIFDEWNAYYHFCSGAFFILVSLLFSFAFSTIYKRVLESTLCQAQL